MRRLCLVVISLAIVSASGGPLPMAAAPGSDRAGHTLRVVRATGQELIVELTATGLDVADLVLDGRRYQKISIPGLGSTNTPGAPLVPMAGALLGVPGVQGLVVEVIDQQVQVLAGYQLAPATDLSLAAPTLDDPTLARVAERVSPDPDRYAQDAFWPPAAVELVETGYMRDQAVATLRFYPVQYNPARGDVRFSERLTVRLTWPATAADAGRSRPPVSPVYEAVLSQSLLNYASLERPPLAALTTEVHRSLGSPTVVAAPPPMLKLGVTADGIYRVTYTDTVAAGWSWSGIDPQTIKIRHRGNALPILVAGEFDGTFDPTDEILFYGTAITDDVYTETNAYWLDAGGAVDGERMSTRNYEGTSTPAADFPETRRFEQDTVYWQTMPNGLGEDHWFWFDRISPNISGLPAFRDYPFTLHNVITATGTATLTVRLKGASSNAGLNGDHRTRFSINGTPVYTATWDGFATQTEVVAFSPGLLLEGANTLRVEALSSGAAVDLAYFNGFEVGFRGQYRADNNELAFHPPAAGAYTIAVKGFATNQVEVFDVTDPADPVHVQGVSVTSDGAGGFQAGFDDAPAANSAYLALTPSRYKSPASIALDEPSSWRSPGHGADYILITSGELYSATLPLAAHRQAQGLRVAVVKVEDLYDEFNDGIFNPSAIRDFLAYAYASWAAPAPSYVLLAGGASYDYRDKLADVNRDNHVPSQMIETFLLGQTASDNWFVAVAGTDLLPDLFVGRLTAESSAEMTAMIGKIIDYDQNPPAESWNDQLLLVADSDASFETSSEQLHQATAAYLLADRVYEGAYVGDPTAGITTAINSGRAFVNYFGHGDPIAWSGQLLTTGDIAGLSNAAQFPVVTVGNCLSGFFVGRAKPSLAEEFLKRSDRGAVAVWAPTGLGFTSGHQALIEGFYQAALYQGHTALGAATTAAKVNLYAQNGLWGELVETFVLFGDPATRIAVPEREFVHIPLVTR